MTLRFPFTQLSEAIGYFCQLANIFSIRPTVAVIGDMQSGEFGFMWLDGIPRRN